MGGFNPLSCSFSLTTCEVEDLLADFDSPRGGPRLLGLVAALGAAWPHAVGCCCDGRMVHSGTPLLLDYNEGNY